MKSFSFYIFLFALFTSNAFSLPPAKIFGILNTWAIERGDDYLVQFNPTDGTYNKLFDVGHFDVDYYGMGFYDENKHIYYWTSGCSGILESVNLVTSKFSKVDIPACIFSIAYDPTSGRGYAITNATQTGIYPELFVFDPDLGNHTKIVDMPNIEEGIGVAAYVPTINSYVFTGVSSDKLVVVNVKTKKYKEAKLDHYIVFLQYDYLKKVLYAINRDDNNALAIILLDANTFKYNYVLHINETAGEIVAAEAYDSVNHVWYISMIEFLVVVNIDKKTIDTVDWDIGLDVEDLQVDPNLSSFLGN